KAVRSGRAPHAMSEEAKALARVRALGAGARGLEGARDRLGSRGQERRELLRELAERHADRVPRHGSLSTMRRTSSDRCMASNGLAMTPAAPRRSIRWRSSSRRRAVTNTTGIAAVRG